MRDEHHIFPKVRFRKKVKRTRHDAFHILFRDRTPWEAAEQLRLWAKKGKITEEFLDQRSASFRNAFGLLFGDEREVANLIGLLKLEWLPQGIYMFFGDEGPAIIAALAGDKNKLVVIFDYAELGSSQKRNKDFKGLVPIGTSHPSR